MASSGVEWLKSVLGNLREPTDIRRPTMIPIEVGSWSRPDNALRTLCITQADRSIRWHLRNHHGVTVPEYERRGLQVVDNERYDVYAAAIPGGRREYWMNVSYWFGRGLVPQANRLDAPPWGEETSLGEFFGPEQIRDLPFQSEILPQVSGLLDQMALRFAGYSSQQFYNNVARMRLEQDRLVIEATAVRRFLADTLPLFHGFRFLKPFLMHQVMHRMLDANPGLTEVSPKADYAVPVPGVDCVQFAPHPQETPAHDFWHYMLCSHRPGAFETEAERRILSFSAATGFCSGFLRPEELVNALSELDVGGAEGEILRDLASGWLIKSDPELREKSRPVASTVPEPERKAAQAAAPLANGGERVTAHGLVAITLPEGGIWIRDEQFTTTDKMVVFWALDSARNPEGCYLVISDATDDPEEPVGLDSSNVSDRELDEHLRRLAEATMAASGVELLEWRGSVGVWFEDHRRLYSVYVIRRGGVEIVNYSIRRDVRGRRLVMNAGVPAELDAERHDAVKAALGGHEFLG